MTDLPPPYRFGPGESSGPTASRRPGASGPAGAPGAAAPGAPVPGAAAPGATGAAAPAARTVVVTPQDRRERTLASFAAVPWRSFGGSAVLLVAGIVVAPLVPLAGTRDLGLVLALLAVAGAAVAIWSWRRDAALVAELRRRPLGWSQTSVPRVRGVVLAVLGTLALAVGTVVPPIAGLVAPPLLLAALVLLPPVPVYVAVEGEGIVRARRGEIREIDWGALQVRPPRGRGDGRFVRGSRLTAVGDSFTLEMGDRVRTAIGDAVTDAWMREAPRRLDGRERLDFGALTLTSTRLASADVDLQVSSISAIEARGRRTRIRSRWGEEIAVLTREIANPEVLDQLLFTLCGLGLPSRPGAATWGTPTGRHD